ncbi:MAG TPA: hypothetical protein VM943_03350 [Pyrinomonadaceae bacterium]|nr:hypothetical protein [Pyrinomonadaceae bacterium]
MANATGGTAAMQRHQLFLIIALSLISYPTAEAKTESSDVRADVTVKTVTGSGREESNPAADIVNIAPAAPVPTPLTLTTNDAIKSSLYMDVFNILKDDNSCSRFFGGPPSAVHVLNQLTLQFRKEPLRSNLVGFQMSGHYINISNRQTGASYRLFDKAIANSRGPIYNRNPHDAEVRRSIGRFQIHTREAKTLMLLHELGHLLPGKDGNWLLPNDGGNHVLSTQNSRTVEQHCLDQIRALKD